MCATCQLSSSLEITETTGQLCVLINSSESKRARISTLNLKVVYLFSKWYPLESPLTIN